jgi:hypothetical protein
MRFMAVGTGDAGVEHPALHERTVFKHLAVDLSVGLVKARFEHGGEIGIEERFTRRRGRSDHLASGMA